MKVYWVSCDKFPKCFFEPTREEAQADCDYRIASQQKPEDAFGRPNRSRGQYGNWFVEEEDIPDSDFGICANDGEPRLPYQIDCATGSVRKLRRGVPDDGKCGTCPYFERHPTIEQAMDDLLLNIEKNNMPDDAGI